MAERAGKRVFVVGVGMSKFVKPGSTEEDYPDFARQAVTMALKDAGIEYGMVEKACVGYVYGDSSCGQRALYELGMSGIHIYNINNKCSTGATALFVAKQLIEGGYCGCVLALGFEKMAGGSFTSMFDDRTDPVDKNVLVPSNTHGLAPAPVAAQLFVGAGREHMEKYGTRAEHFAMIALKNHMHSTKNPYSQCRDEYSLEQILNSPAVYEPLTELQCCRTSDGAAAAILASESFVLGRKLEGQAVEILGMAMASDIPYAFNVSSCIKMVGFDMTWNAANKLFKRASVNRSDVDVVELHDCFSTNELITYEALGLCPIGKGGEMVEKGDNTYGGKYVINPSGGLISRGHPLGATGIAQCAELCWQLRNLAGPRQVSNAKLALQHNMSLGRGTRRVVVALYRLGFALTGEPSALPTPPKEIFKLKSGKIITKAFELMQATEGAFDKRAKGSLKLHVSDDSSNYVVTEGMSLEDGKISISFDPDMKADCTIFVSDSVLHDVLCGKLTVEEAFFTGKLKLTRNGRPVLGMNHLSSKL